MKQTMVPASVIGLVMSLLLSPGPAGAGDDLQQLRQDVESVKSDTETIKTDTEMIKKQLLDIQKFLSQRVAQADRGPVKMSVGGGPMLGRPDAPVTMVEFSDYECPFCRRHFSSTFQELKTAYIDTGKLRYVFRDFPLEKLHPDAHKAAEAAHCAGDQGKFWEMHDSLFANQGALKPDNIRAFARDLKLDVNAFDACLDSGRNSAIVTKHLADGSAAGIAGTPGFFIGKTQENGTIEAMFIKGAQPTAAFSQVIDGLLEAKTP